MSFSGNRGGRMAVKHIMAFSRIDDWMFDKSINDNYKEVDTEMDIVKEACIKADKYQWHDLRKNPADLPTVNGKYRVVYADDTYEDMLECYTAYFNIEFQHFGYYEQMEHNELDGSPIEFWFEWDNENIVIAWKYIDLFEGVEG